MTNLKQIAVQVISGLPPNSSWDDILSALEFVKPWQRIPSDEGVEAKSLEAELYRELPDGHALKGLECRAIATRVDCDDVLFQLVQTPSRYAVVHLTRSGQREQDTSWPSTTLHDSYAEFARECMLSDAADYQSDFLEEDLNRIRQ